ncbi:MAG: ATP-binding protein [Firmicutes bacterium]|nr:ATP-binding protein [Bacillota bacterium]
MKLIERKSYLNQLINVMNTPDIKVITGVRRCGKSKLMDAFISYVQKQSANNNVIRIKLNLKEFESLKIGDNLYKYVDTRYTTKKQNFLFVDEVQLCDGFETVINSLYEEERFNIFLTGSNAFLLSSDLATLFGGRVFEISLYPFSFSEYLLYYPQTDIDDAFDKYVITGGMAGSYLYNDSADSRKYLSNIVRTTITKDIVKKFKIENEDLLNMIVDFLMDNIGSKTSIRNIANALTSNTYKTNDKTCGAYIDYICRSFLFYPFKRYDVKGKRYLESDKKYYLADLSFRFAVIGTKNADYGHLYENLVAIELLRRGYEVYVGQLGEKEVDFVAVKDGYKTYIQVCDDISREETLQREISPLLAIKDAYPKVIIARTKHPESQVEGIRIIDIARWLVSQI